MKNNIVCTSYFGEEQTHMGHDVLAGVAHLAPIATTVLAHFVFEFGVCFWICF